MAVPLCGDDLVFLYLIVPIYMYITIFFNIQYNFAEKYDIFFSLVYVSLCFFLYMLNSLVNIDLIFIHMEYKKKTQVFLRFLVRGFLFY